MNDSNILFQLFTIRYVKKQPNTLISYIDILSHVFEKLKIFDTNITYDSIYDYYNGYIYLHTLKVDGIKKVFNGVNHYLVYGTGTILNDKACVQLKSICYYIMDNNLYDCELFNDRLEFLTWCKNLKIDYDLKIGHLSVFRTINGKMELDDIKNVEIKLLVQGVKENYNTIWYMKRFQLFTCIFVVCLLLCNSKRDLTYDEFVYGDL
jgi:hypothetical protein